MGQNCTLSRESSKVCEYHCSGTWEGPTTMLLHQVNLQPRWALCPGTLLNKDHGTCKICRGPLTREHPALSCRVTNSQGRPRKCCSPPTDTNPSDRTLHPRDADTDASQGRRGNREQETSHRWPAKPRLKRRWWQASLQLTADAALGKPRRSEWCVASLPGLSPASC